MKIHNVRLGFATNSSSTHSIVYTDGTVSNNAGEHFGWDTFTAVSHESKAQYLAATLYGKLAFQVSQDIALAVVKEWANVELTVNDYGEPSAYVDHQSMIELPYTYDVKGIHKEFFKELSDYILQEGVAILGGNDNGGGDSTHPLISNTEVPLPLPRDHSTRRYPYVARKDDEYGYWTLFSRIEGTKIRFSFGEADFTPDKASAPELVDMKITDFCSKLAVPLEATDYNGKVKIDAKGYPIYKYTPEGSLQMGIGGGGECAYCYQGSSPMGKHASTSFITSMLYAFSQAEVFEVAFGGGETTQHPDFAEIIDFAHTVNIVPNFTTKSLQWLKEPWAYKVLDQCGGFAYSVTSHAQVTKFVKALAKLGYPTPENDKRLYIHYVLGTTTEFAYKKILTEAYKNNVTVILLGYKTNGRGATFTPYYHANWLAIIQDMRANGLYIRLGIDTAIASQFKELLEAYDISKYLYHTEEGKFSCYVDAVTKQIGPSSYADKSTFSDVTTGNWNTTFKTY